MTTPQHPFTEFERDPDADVGVMWDHFITAIGIWVYVNSGHREVTVAEAALTFNTTPDLVREAVATHPWLFASDDPDPSKQTIESDGA
jgi:hypothetical protein